MWPESLHRAAGQATRQFAQIGTRRWKPYTRLFLVGESAGWVIDEEMRSIGWLASTLGIATARVPLAAADRQAVFYGSQFALFGRPPIGRGHRLATAYFHGRPGTPGMPEFDETYAALRVRHGEIHRIQVSHREMEAIVLESGIAPEKVFRIPIGIDISHFTPQTPALRTAVRAELGLPQNAFVIGSFQKDGVGWGDGTEPKLIKGPDVLVDALESLHARLPELHVLLSGPARGYVRGRLERSGVPYVHRFLERYGDIGRLYGALDAYVVPARQEGGPKGVLEAMAAGVPLVSTRVGQAVDLMRDGENGWLVDVDEPEAIADALERIAHRTVARDQAVAAGLETAAEHTYEAQLPLWRTFFDGFVEAR